jgi:hypothetical protein
MHARFADDSRLQEFNERPALGGLALAARN